MRYAPHLRQRYRAILSYTGALWVFSGVFMLSPLAVLPAFPSELPLAWGFVWPGGGMLLVGALTWLLCRTPDRLSLSLQEGSLMLVFVWLPTCLVGAVPFVLSGGLSFPQALFESTSGWTTTGLSVVDVNRASPLILLYRSVMQLVGGAGFAILMLSAVLGPAGTGLSEAEGRGDRLEPNVRRSAAIVIRMYSGYVLLGVVGLYAAGMGWFDALNHAFTAVSTGGFSTRANSIGHWDSVWVEAVVLGLMLLGTTNFLTSYALVRGKFRVALRSGELRLLALLAAVSVPALLIGVGLGLYSQLGKAARVAVFETLSALSTTGFSTVGYGDWPAFGWLVLIGLMLIGGGSGSTAGGMKQFRVYALYRGLRWELRRAFLPPHALTQPDIWQGEHRRFLTDLELRRVGLFVFLYLGTFLLGSALVSSFGYTVAESLFEVASTLGTVGLSAGVTSPEAPVGLLAVQIVGMLLGRLEFLAVVVGSAKLLRNLGTLLRRSG